MYREEIYPNISTKSGIALIINQMGEIKYLLKDFQGSLKDFQKAVKLNPNYARYNYNLGVVLVENPVNMDYEDACKYLVKAKKQGFDLDEKDLITPNGFNYCK